MPETFIHIWSDVAGDRRPSNLDDATDHADAAGHSTIAAASIRGLRLVFERLLRDGRKVDRLDFHTHGGPGALAIGSEYLDYRGLKSNFAGRGFEKVFNADARVFFHGCKVAASAEGEMFLAVFGAIFLRQGGGRVGGSTSSGIAVPIWPFTGKVVHPGGRTVYAHVKPGGDVHLENHDKLNTLLLRQRVEGMQRAIAGIRVRHHRGRQLADAKDLIRDAERYLRPAAPAFVARLYAAISVRDAERLLRPLLGVDAPGVHQQLYRMTTQSMPSFR